MIIPEISVLPNKLTVLYMHYPESLVTHCGLLMKAGTRDEEKGKDGLAHFIEHTLFKGTKNRKSFHILNRLEVVGGELNAYTTKEETCLHASVMNRYFERAVDLIADVAFQSIFPEKEIEKEKEVITDEIRAYQDTPYEQIFDDFESQLFKGHTLGHNFLGTEESIRKFKRKDILNYVGDLYDPSNMIFAVSGSIGMKEVIRLAEKYFGVQKHKKTPPKRYAFKKYSPQFVTEKKSISQVHYIMGRPALGVKDPRRFTLILFNNLLGGPGMNSRLNLNIREKHGFTYTIESGFHSYTDTGVFHIYFATDEKHFEKTRKLLDRELDILMDKKLSDTVFKQYKEQLIGQIQLGQENRLSVLLSVAKSQLNLGKIVTLKDVNERINRITPKEVRDLANEILNQKSRSELIYLPNP
ncbi:MAG: insulinase family protein [Bacteroidetes bacterium]|nr:insulinase family protein [Bacteroidota bacterium]